MTYMTGTIRTKSDTVYGIFAHYSFFIELLTSEDPEQLIKRNLEDETMEINEGESRIGVDNSIIIDFLRKRILDIDNSCFDVTKYVSDEWTVDRLSVREILQDVVNDFFQTK